MQAENASAQQIIDALRTAFETPVHIAERDDDGFWVRHVANDVHGTLFDSLDPQQQDACQQAYENKCPAVVERLDGTSTLAAPTGADRRSAQMAVTEVAGARPSLIKNLANACIESVRQSKAFDEAQVEIQFLVEQLAAGLEELTFLRSVSSQFDLSDSETQLSALWRSTLEALNTNVNAECLAMLEVTDKTDPLHAKPVHIVGPNPMTAAAVTKVVRLYGQDLEDQPMVKNKLALAPEGSALPEVRELILVPLFIKDSIIGWLLAVNRDSSRPAESFSAEAVVQWEFGTSEATLMSTTGTMMATHASNLDLFREKEQLLIGVVRSLVSAIEAKDNYTCGHSERVALFGKLLASQCGYSDEACDQIYLTGLLHDVGKIGVSDEVLKKEGRLTEEEFAEIQRHPDEGWAILHELEQLRNVLPGVLHHHERYDGRGYPDQLVGEAIPLDGRILSVVDAYDAMTSDRPYRKGMPPEKAQEILRSGAGTQWDRQIIEAFFAVLPKIEHVRCNYRQRPRPTRNTGVNI